MLTNIIFVSPCFHFLMNLQLNIWVYTMFSEIYKILFATITTVGSYIFRIKFKCFFMLFKYRDKGVVIRSVALTKLFSKVKIVVNFFNTIISLVCHFDNNFNNYVKKLESLLKVKKLSTSLSLVPNVQKTSGNSVTFSIFKNSATLVH